MASTGSNEVHTTSLNDLLRRFNDTQYSYPANQTVHALFEQQAAHLSDKLAAVHLDQSITYGELNHKANQLARRLRADGIGPHTIVALMVDRSIMMFIGLLGILKAGAAYLPIDPGFPEARIQYMLADAGVALMLTERALMDTLSFAGALICLDDADTCAGDESNLDPLAEARDLAYIIYTSGSTGQPKGVMIEHQSIHNFILGITRQIDFAPTKTIVCLTTISFDIFVLESLLPLSQGLSVLIADPMQFARHLAGQRIDMLQTTPSTMQMLLQDAACLPYVRQCSEIMLGGEPFPRSLLLKLRDTTTARLYNMYGPTETTVWSTIQELTLADEITIGRPIANTQLYILDEQHQPLGPGALGELCIAGDGVARGYLKRPELTATKFVPNPFVSLQSPLIAGARLYKTGDLASWLPDGQIAFFGRGDSQVKVRGFRIELGEIEDRLGVHPQIRECAVAAKRNEHEEAYLVAYYTADGELTASELIAFLGQHLPDYMIPGVYLRLESMPRTPNAKLDRRALPMPDTRRPRLNSEYIAPASDLEQQLAEIWRSVLHRDEVGIHDNFFELGGNSILLAQMFNAVEQLQPGRISIADVFAYPTIAKLTRLLQSASEAALAPPLPTRLYPTHGRSRSTPQAHVRTVAAVTEDPQNEHPAAVAHPADPIAFVFPGQGAQSVGMGQQLYNRHTIAQQVFAEASDALGFDLRRLCFEGSLHDLTRTENTQPAILTVSVAASRVLLSEYGLTPRYLAGHSLGEITALVCAEAIRFWDAVKLVRARGLAMHAAAPGSGAMMAITGLGSEAIKAECAKHASDSAVVSISNYNTPDQVVISGQRHAVVAVGHALKQRGASVIELKVSTPFHCALMQPAVEQFRAELARIAVAPLKYPVISNVTAAPYVSADSISELLTTQIVKPVQWYGSLRCLLNLGVKTIIDVGPGDVLRNMAKKTYPYLDVFAFDDEAAPLDWHHLKPPPAVPAEERSARYALIERCLALALCTPNYSIAGESAGTVLQRYRQVEARLSRLRQAEQPPDLDDLRQAIQMLTDMFRARQTPPAEQFERLNTLLHESGLPEVVSRYLPASMDRV